MRTEFKMLTVFHVDGVLMADSQKIPCALNTFFMNSIEKPISIL